MISLMDLIWATETEEEKQEDEYGVNIAASGNSNQMEQYCSGAENIIGGLCSPGRW